jgi:type IV pilus assembly protein PilP
MRKSNGIACSFTTALLLVLCGHAAGGADVPAKVSTRAPAVAAPAKAGAVGVPAKAPAAAAPAAAPLAESFTYNPAGKPDPFIPFIEKDLIIKKKADKSSAPSIFPLQNAAVDQFKLVGIAGDERHRIAVVEDERGKVYTMREGTYIGQNNGRVKAILADQVIVEEKIGTDSGKVRINRITVRLHKEDNEGKP